MSKNIEKAFAGGLFAITLLTYDLAGSERFYGEFLGLNKVWGDEVSAIYKVGGTMINVLSDALSAELLEPAKLAAVGAGEKAVYTLRCPDVDATCTELEAAGVTIVNGPVDRPWGVRTASFQDPSGNIWELANHA
jgi:catechol 2,3-dioxygenase-like lactoylglutathione lyase family enzyme